MRNTLKAGSVFITGASSGIGEECTLYLSSLGFRIFAGVRKKEDFKALIKLNSYNIVPVLIDITNAASVLKAVRIITPFMKKHGLSGLINNAGIALGGPLEFLPVKEIQNQFEVNVIGHIRVIQAFLPFLRKGHGRIINIGSISGRISGPFIGPYAASKFALRAITDSFRMELYPWDIPVSLIEAGRIATPIWEKSLIALNKIIKEFPSHARKLYGATLDKANEKRKRIGEIGISPAVVAKAVAHILTTKRPKTRYLVGRDAKFLNLIIKSLPDRIHDWFIMKQLGLKIYNC